MERERLFEKLEELLASPAATEEEVAAHYRERGYDQISYHGRPVFLFTDERDFGSRRHIVSLHGPSPAIPEHIFRYPILKYCLRGTWTIIADGTPVSLAPGECLLTDRTVPQAIEPCAPGMLGANIILNEEYFATHLLSAPRSSLSDFERELVTAGSAHDGWRHFPTADDATARSLMHLVLEELVAPGARTDEMTDALIEALFVHLFGTFEKAPAGSEAHSRLMGTIREYIARNFREGSMEKMAADLGYQRSYLSRIIRESTGTTFKQLVNAERMKRATVLLEASEQPVYEIADEVGIANLTSFYERFRAWAGCTPSQWRKRSQNGRS
jgi:AraC-like DNA-binding protein